MPTSRTKNLIYRAALPLLAPRGRDDIAVQGLRRPDGYRRILRRHHVQGSSLLLTDGPREAAAFCGCGPETLFRVASITKMATALTVLRLCAEGALGLDQPVAELLPEGHEALRGVTVRHLLSHTSGLRDTGEEVLLRGGAYPEALRRGSEPGAEMVYCNLGFGLLGCVMEYVTGQSLEAVFQQKLFVPLGMRATLDGSTLEPLPAAAHLAAPRPTADAPCHAAAAQTPGAPCPTPRDITGTPLPDADAQTPGTPVMPIIRVLPHRPGRAVTVTALGRRPLTEPDPLRHFGHTAGAMYTDARSVSRLLTAVTGDFLPEPLRRAMTTRHAATPTRVYGLGLVILQRPGLSPHRLLGHQGFAYGCVDGAFVEEETGRQVIFLNGGASEAREGRLGLVNRDVLRWALKEEMPSWT